MKAVILGVILSRISDASCLQQHLIDEIKNRPQRRQLMQRIDHLNHRFGVKTIHFRYK